MTASMCSMRFANHRERACSDAADRAYESARMAPRDPRFPPGPAIGGRERIGIGLAALGRPGYLNVGHGADLGSDRSVDALRARSFEVLDAAYAAGVRYFDTARSYGRGEEFLGAWLGDRDPEGVVVGSKWGYVYTAEWEVDADPPEVKHHDAATFRRQLEETRANLGERLALYQIHSATPDSGVLENDEVLEELAALRATGVAIGLTTSGTSQAQTLERALELDLFDTAQVTWNLHERAAGPALARAHDAGMGTIVKEALANGRLATRGAHAALDRVADRLGAAPDAVALAAVLAQPFVDIVLSGAATTGALRSNLAAATVELDADALAELDALEERSDAYWEARSDLELDLDGHGSNESTSAGALRGENPEPVTVGGRSHAVALQEPGARLAPRPVTPDHRRAGRGPVIQPREEPAAPPLPPEREPAPAREPVPTP